ncbi:ABC transporter permease [Cytobacillus purgationiresistens]|uniref:ABC-2 type transport system permease protein n=1 Tax=Cytobacillus purgationiresistens TaxID=863449 RepID=A0ABU0AKK6_9BACI|nr:ABC transporter permease [Cytobacillus purgationiresistens]MDQ0271811.1 ABC-2 type transport system permease protein [Cytobacillus purgationiresistens]
MRISALSLRILRQIIRDKRTMALLIFAPILVLTLLHFVFNGNDYEPKIGFVSIPETMENQLNIKNTHIQHYKNLNTAKADLSDQSIDAYLFIANNHLSLFLEGSDPTVNSTVMKRMQDAFQSMGGNEQTNNDIKIHFLHGGSELGQFDYIGPLLLGFFVFFFVFLIAGVSFLRERTTGTLERLLSTPIKKSEIVFGYVIGFGIFTIIQTFIIAIYTIYVLGMYMEGAFGYVMLIALFTALTALTLGILLSSFANNELQMMQFIPIIIVPQIFFSGLFNLETIPDWLSWIGPLTPLYYAADALKSVMVSGMGWSMISKDIFILAGFSLLFILLNILALKKYRKI